MEIWVVGDSRGLRTDSEPVTENETYSQAAGTVRLRTAVRDVAAFQVALRTRTPPIGPLDVRVEALRSDDGRPLAAPAHRYRMDAVRVQRFESWYAAFVRLPVEPVEVLDVLVPWDAPRGGGPVRLPDGSTAGVWIDIPIPPGTPPGRYSGRLVVEDLARRRTLHVSRIDLRVLPVAIPAEPALPVLARVDPSDLLAGQLNWPRRPAPPRIITGDPTHAAAVRLVRATMTLLHVHRLTPVLWATLPDFVRAPPDRGGGLDVRFDDYDALVAGFIDGSAYADRVPPARWPLPVCEQHPDVRRNGGLDSPRYARLLRDYLARCVEYFRGRGWLDRAFVRFFEPDGYDARRIDRVARLLRIVQQAELSVPLAAHLPMQSLAGLGWIDAPPVELPNVGAWLTPAEWFEPAAATQRRALGARIGLLPGAPPFSPSLAVEAGAADPRLLGWLAFRYGLDLLWIEHAADRDGLRRGRAGDAPLVWPGRPYGLRDAPVPSARLKRLRRGLLDYALLDLLRRNGRTLLADRTARRVVPRALTDACDDNLLTWDRTGFEADPFTLALARRALLSELARALSPQSVAADRAARSEWARVLASAPPLRVRVIGTRLTTDATGLLATVICQADNAGPDPLTGTWSLPGLPPGWELVESPQTALEPAARSRIRLRLRLRGLAYNADGVLPFRVRFTTRDGATYDADARLAVAACPWTDAPPAIDGDLSDWPVLPNNTAGAFALVRGQRRGGGASLRPTLATRAAFARDGRYLYVAVHAALPPGELPRWRADNRIPTDRGMPWDQDRIEVLLDPQNLPDGPPGAIRMLSIKPSGLVRASLGPQTDPPLCRSRPWPVDPIAAVRVARGRSWTVELAIPLEALGPAGGNRRIFGCNVTRFDAARGEYSSWSAARGSTYSPARLGNLLMP